MIDKNVWQSTASAELIDAMRLCGCDAKYIDGKASDFEKLCEFLLVAKLMRGHSCVSEFLKTLKNKYGLALSEHELIPENARILWQAKDAKNSDFQTFKNEKSVEKYKRMSDALILNDIKKGALDYDAFIDGIKNKLVAEKTSVITNLSGDSFCAPNPYLAKIAFENCQKTQDDILICQILCEILSDIECQKTQIYLNDNGTLELAKQFIEYLKKHNMSGRISVEVTASDEPSNILEACRLSEGDCFVTPYIILSKNKNYQNLEHFRNKLSKIYPIGMLDIFG